MTYNLPHTIFYKAGKNLKRFTDMLIKDLKAKTSHLAVDANGCCLEEITENFPDFIE
jgi:hypothetical protein